MKPGTNWSDWTWNRNNPCGIFFLELLDPVIAVPSDWMHLFQQSSIRPPLLKRVLMIISGFLLLILVLLTGPLWVYLSGQLDLKTHWSSASRESTGTAPSPQRFPEASVRVYYARSFHWRGAFGVHSWLAIKEKNGSSYQIFQVIGWRLFGNHSSVDVHWGDPARYWYGEKPILLGEISGADAEKAIPKIRDAAENYPYAWNSCLAWTEQQHFHLPPDPLRGEFSLRPASPRNWQRLSCRWILLYEIFEQHRLAVFDLWPARFHPLLCRRPPLPNPWA